MGSILIILSLVIGCHYYKVTTSQDHLSDIKAIENSDKHIIIHQGPNVWSFTDIELNDDRQELSGFFKALHPNEKNYLKTNPYINNRYKLDEGNPINQVHIYTSEFFEDENSRITIPLSTIGKIEIYDEAIGATVASYVFTGVGIAAGVVVIIGVVAILTKSSCPFVYVNNGNSYYFAGEMYGGAIYASLERDDYMPLPGIKLLNGQYLLKISNELLEKQYTNLAELIVIEHPHYSTAIIDKSGGVQIITSPISPSSAQSNNNIDYLPQVLSRDNNSYLFNENYSENNNLSSLNLSFKKELKSKTAKLILKAKNSFWLDYIYGKFNEQFGSYYNKFVEKQKEVATEDNIQWSLEQGIPLSVHVETENGWEFVDYFDVIGPLFSREIVMPIDLSNIKGGDVNIKLECGFMFWEIDYVSMDFSNEIPIKINHITASSAIDEKGMDVLPQISDTDDEYLIQPEVGNEVILKYVGINTDESNLQTVFLHSRGYYEYIRDYEGVPNLFYLNSFKKEGAFTKFSKERYYKFIQQNDFFVTVLNENNGN